MKGGFGRALAVSVGLHAAVLALASIGLRRAVPSSPPPAGAASMAGHATRVRIFGRESRVAPAGPPAPVIAAPARHRTGVRNVLRPCAGADCASAEPTAAVALPRPTEAEDTEASGSVLGGSTPVGANTGSAPGGAMGQGGAEDAPARWTDALHRRLAEAAARCYPTAAKRFRTRGEVVLGFCLDASGHSRDVAVRSSSQSPLLDGAATDCVLPGALPFAGAAGCYTVPVRFGD